jgi:hypothetical protein
LDLFGRASLKEKGKRNNIKGKTYHNKYARLKGDEFAQREILKTKSQQKLPRDQGARQINLAVYSNFFAKHQNVLDLEFGFVKNFFRIQICNFEIQNLQHKLSCIF